MKVLNVDALRTRIRHVEAELEYLRGCLRAALLQRRDTRPRRRSAKSEKRKPGSVPDAGKGGGS